MTAEHKFHPEGTDGPGRLSAARAFVPGFDTADERFEADVSPVEAVRGDAASDVAVPEPASGSGTRAAATPSPAPQAPETPDAPSNAALFDARGLELRTSQSRVFGPVDWTVPADSHGVVLGEQGSGRSAFLLALAGRMQGIGGSLQVGDIEGVRQARQLRKEVSVARITDFAELEPLLTVAETIDERALMEGMSVRRGRQAFTRLERAVDARFEYYDHIEDLPAVQRTTLALLLGAIRPARYVVLDDIDDSLTADQLGDVYAVLEVLRDLGHRYVVSALTTSAVPRHCATVTLAPAEAADRLALQFGHLRPRRITPKES